MNILELKIQFLKDSLDGLNSKLDTSKEKIRDWGHRTEENLQSDAWKHKKDENKEKIKGQSLIYMWLEPQKERRERE